MPYIGNPRSRRATQGGLRKYRQKISMEGAVIAGDPRLAEIVYCYRFPSCPGRVKIGYSSRGMARVADQSTAFPEKPELIFVIHDRRARAIEVAFHEALANRQADVMGTEWFDAGWPELLAVSPILRSARGARRSLRRGLATACLVALCLCLYSPLAISQIMLAKSMSVSAILSVWSDHAGLIASGRILDLVSGLTGTISRVVADPMPVAYKLIPVCLASAPMTLPLIFRRRQAY